MESVVRSQYNQVAAIYDRRWNSYISRTLSFLDKWSNLPSAATVLDVACGTGEFERLILAKHPGQRMVGVDISEKMVEIARQKLQPYPNVAFQIASVADLPFEAAHFDTVVSANAFHYFDSPTIALAEMKRVLKPDGRVIILDWCKDFWVCRICDWVLQRLDPAHRQCYTQAEFHQFLADAGFQIERSAKVRFGLIWGLMVATARPLP